MAKIGAYIEQYFEVLFALSFLWIAAWVGISAIYRRSKGKPIRPEPPANAIFVEKWTSGRSLRSLVTRLGGARNVLFVAVTPDALIIRPHFPFTLGFLPEMYGLDWSIALSDIRRISSQRGILKDSVLVEFSMPQARTENVELMLREPEMFRQALGK